MARGAMEALLPVPIPLVRGVALYAMLGAAAVCDARWRIIPNRLIACGVVGWLACGLCAPSWDYVAAGLASGLGVSVIPCGVEIWCRMRKAASVIGGGDLKLLFASGLFLPMDVAFWGLFLACAVGAAMGLAMRKRSRYHPFGIAIAIGFGISELLMVIA